MKATVLSLMILISVLASCTKEHPVEPANYDLVGMWASIDHTTTWVIDNTTGVGINVKFTEITQPDGRYLKVNVSKIQFNETFKIVSIDSKSMRLLDSKNVEWYFIRKR